MARQIDDERAPPTFGAVEAVSGNTSASLVPLRVGVITSALLGGGALGLGAAMALQNPAALSESATGVLTAIFGVKALILFAATLLVLARARAVRGQFPMVRYAAGLAVSAAGLAWLYGLSGLLFGSTLFYGGLLSLYSSAKHDPGLALALAGPKR